MTDDAAHGRAVLLYDGECGFCAGSVQWMLRREAPERAQALCFAPLQGAYAAAVRTAHPEIGTVDSVVWVERRPDGTTRVALRSEAALMALRHLGGAWHGLAVAGRLVPRRWRDGVYDAIARRRLSLAASACLLPTPEQRQRFLP